VVVLLVLLLRGFVEEFGIVIWPIAVAGILALILQPVVRVLQTKVGMSRLWAVVFLYVVAVAGLLVLRDFFIPIIVQLFLEFNQPIPHIIQNFLNSLDNVMPQRS